MSTIFVFIEAKILKNIFNSKFFAKKLKYFRGISRFNLKSQKSPLELTAYFCFAPLKENSHQEGLHRARNADNRFTKSARLSDEIADFVRKEAVFRFMTSRQQPEEMCFLPLSIGINAGTKGVDGYIILLKNSQLFSYIKNS